MCDNSLYNTGVQPEMSEIEEVKNNETDLRLIVNKEMRGLHAYLATYSNSATCFWNLSKYQGKCVTFLPLTVADPKLAISNRNS